MKPRPLFIVMSAPSGCGKSTLIDMLLQQYPDLQYSISCTTRKPRGDEEDGIDYHFLTVERFRELLAEDAFLEHAEVHGNYYGTPLREALQVVESGRNLLLEIEVEGAMNIKRQYPEAVLIMLLPPSFSEQERRLRSRGTETDEVIAGRLKQTYEEMTYFDRYDYVVINKTVDKCADDIQDIVHAEKWAIKRNLEVPTTYFKD